MMTRKKLWCGLLVLAAVLFFMSKSGSGRERATAVRELKPDYGNIQKFISATGTVQPQNRLEMKPPIAGRVEKIYYEEGQTVKIGDVLALMSSTDRAALLDAARPQGEKVVQYWEDVYKPTPLIAPIDGQVIVRTIQPGQTVTTSDAVLVLSDRLIVQAQIDETDIGSVKEGQSADITLDAYPDVEVKAKVGHIYHESKIVNNVTIYQADIIPDTVPHVFRSGMSANVRILEQDRVHVLLVPLEAVKHEKDGNYVMLKDGKGRKPKPLKVELGVSDETNVEVLSGIGPDNTIVIQSVKYDLPKQKQGGSNPFMPFGQRKGQGGGRSSK